MKKTVLITTLSLAVHFSTFAGPAPTSAGEAFVINGKFYHNLELIAVHEGVADFKCKEGSVSAPWSSLPEIYQRHHAKEKAELETPRMHLEVIQVLPTGILADHLKGEDVSGGVSSSAGVGGGGGVGRGGVRYRLSGKNIFVQGISDLVDKDRVVIRAKRDGVYTYQDTGGARRTVEKWVFTEKLGK